MPGFRHKSSAKLYSDLTSHSKFVPQVIDDTLGLLVLHVSEGCNLCCKYCFADKGQYGSSKRKWMSTDTAIKAVDSVAHRYKKIQGIKFFGGEPLLNLNAIAGVCKHVDRLVKTEIMSEHPDLHAVTNLTICNDELLHIIQTYDLSLTGSIDGPKPVNDQFRVHADGKGTFDKIDKNIDILLSKVNQPSALEIVYSPVHIENCLSMIDVHLYLEKRFGIKNIILHPMEMHPPASLLIAKELWEIYSNTMYDLSYEYGKFIVRHSYEIDNTQNTVSYFTTLAEPYHKDAHCDLGVDTITITADRSIYPCYTLISEEKFKMADNCDIEVFNTDRYSNIQRMFVENKKSSNPVCEDCSIVKTCKQCPGEMFLQNGNINSIIPNACSYMTGYAEGMLTELNIKRSDNRYWSEFTKILQYNHTQVNSSTTEC